VDERYKLPEMMCIMQCTSMYPIPDSDANLRVMESFRAFANLSVGYSDHTIGMTALIAAAAMGAEVLEFHFTLSRENQTFRDHQVSLIPEEVLKIKEDIFQISTLRGSNIKRPQLSELNNKHDISFRRGAFTSRTIKKGSIIQLNDVILLRPAHGTDARDVDSLVGATALRDIEPFRAIKKGEDYLRQGNQNRDGK